MAGINDEGRQWYAISCYSGHENKVKEDLTKRIESMGLQECLFQIIIPEVDKEVVKTKKKDGKEIQVKEVIKENLFPGYVLVEMIMTDEAWYVVRNTAGVTGFIGSSGGGAKPFPIIAEELEPIFKKMGIHPKGISVNFEVGDEVQIVDGPLQGETGTVQAIDEEKGEVKISYVFMKQATTATLDVYSVKKVEM